VTVTGAVTRRAVTRQAVALTVIETDIEAGRGIGSHRDRYRSRKRHWQSQRQI
jgi:hypothetical protein